MGLDNLVNDNSSNDSEAKNKDTETNQSGTSKKYVKITREEFEEFLDNKAPYFWKIVDTDAGEIIYETDEFMFEYQNITLRIFSTIEKGVDVVRGKGDDAIRTVIWSKEHNAPIGGRTKTLRIQTWRKNLLKKINSLSDEWHNYVDPCPECSGWLVEREGKNGKFLGCINWTEDGSGCNYIKNIYDDDDYVKECPVCNDGKLVKRDGQYGKFLGCTNWEKDGSGCNYNENLD